MPKSDVVFNNYGAVNMYALGGKLTVTQVASLLNVSNEEVERQISLGNLEVVQGKGSYRRVTNEALHAYVWKFRESY